MATDDEKLLYGLDATLRGFMDTMRGDHKDLRANVDKIFGVVEDIRTVQAVLVPQIERLKDFSARLDEQERASDERGATLVRTVQRVEKIDGDLSRMGAKVDILMTRTEPKPEPEPEPEQKSMARTVAIAGSPLALVAAGLIAFWEQVKHLVGMLK
jgi:hypothetical protein